MTWTSHGLLTQPWNKCAALFFLGFVTAVGASAQTSSLKADCFNLEENFQPGWREASAGLGVLFPNTVRRNDRPDVNYVLLCAELGYMVNEPAGPGILRGNLELVPEIFGAEIYGGPGNYIAGAGVLLRYNFVPRESRLIPFVEFGGGATVMDIPHQYDGKSFNFHVDVDVGLRYFIRPKCSLNAQYMFQHISNADLWSKNVGVNTSGPIFGVSLFF